MVDQDFTSKQFTKEEVYGLFAQYKDSVYTLARKAIDLGLCVEISAYNFGMVKFSIRDIDSKPGWSKTISIWPDQETYEEVIYKEDGNGQ